MYGYMHIFMYEYKYVCSHIYICMWKTYTHIHPGMNTTKLSNINLIYKS